MPRFQDIVTDNEGNGLPGAIVTVRDYPSGNLSTLTADSGGSLTNPIVADSNGAYYFNTANAIYSLEFRLLAYEPAREVRLVNLGNLIDSVTLADGTSTANGAGLVAFNSTLSYLTGTVGGFLKSLIATGGASLIGANDGSAGSLFTTVGGFIAKLLSSAGSSVIGFIQSGTGAVSRSLQSILRDRAVSVVSYGAVLDGVTDNSVAVQNALNSGAASVFIPAGSCAWTSVTIPAQVKLCGLSRLSTAVALGNTGNFITFGGGQGELCDLTITAAVQRTGGCYVNIPQSDIRLNRIKFLNGFQIINVPTPGAVVFLNDLHLRDNNNAGGSALITINTTGGNVLINKIIADNAGAQPLAGIQVLACGDLTITDGNIIHCGTNLLVAPPASSIVASLYAANTFFDTATKGVSIKPASGGSVVRTHLENVWGSSHSSHGFEIDGSAGTVNGVTLVDPQANLCGGDGIHLVGCQNVKIIGGQAAQNTGSGFSADATASKFVVRELSAGAGDGLTGNGYGINIATGASDFDADDNFCSGNTTADIVGVVASLASATTLPIPARGKKFNVTGTTGITGMTAFAGRRVSLFFAGVLTVTSGTGTAISIRLASGSNFTTAAGASLTLEHNGTQWYEVGRAA